MAAEEEGIECGGGIVVWKPVGYDDQPGCGFPVIHLRGGLLPAGGVSPPHPVATAGRLAAAGVLPPCLVAIHPRSSPPSIAEAVRSVDRAWRTLPKPSARVLVAASLDAAAALAEVLEQPRLFGGVAGLSTSFEGPEGAPPASSTLLRRFEEAEWDPGRPRLYFDHGDQGLDECYDVYHRQVADILRHRGWRHGVDFVVSKVPGGSHSAASWEVRLVDALRFAARQISR
jgi:hypothetical protein